MPFLYPIQKRRAQYPKFYSSLGFEKGLGEGKIELLILTFFLDFIYK